MATGSAMSADDRRKRVLLGDLPEDFLRIATSSPEVLPPGTTPVQSENSTELPPLDTAQQIAADEQTALAMQRRMNDMLTTPHPIGRLTLTVVEAKLVKNYGMTRMDPYVRLRIGHNIYETHTHYNGAKNPRWDKVFHCFIPPGVNSFLVEIYDECAFTASEKIAWAHVNLPESVMKGETMEEWAPLNGKQGDGKEGAINVVMSYVTIPGGTMIAPQVMYLNGNPVQSPFGFGPSVTPVAAAYGAPAPVGAGPQNVGTVGGQTVIQGNTPPPARITITEDDIKQLQEMFPSIEKAVIEGILESHRGNKDAAITDLLQLSN